MEYSTRKLLPKLVTVAVFLISLISIFELPLAAKGESNLETYVVLVNKPEGVYLPKQEELKTWYLSFLPETVLKSDKKRMVHTYHNVVTGFAAKLSAEEAKAMEEKEGLMLVRPERFLSLHTTHTPDFLGLHMNLGFWNSSHYGDGVIIGLLDTGIAPDHPSFNDEGMLPPPAKWKGRCEFNGTACNNKLIGARNFLSYGNLTQPPFDGFGHGTHTASTAAGSPVQNASFYGQLNGTAIGIAPKAHLAMYKVCGSGGGCSESAILAAMDAAVDDGVDILSLSLGGPSFPYYDDVIALGAYGATQKGVFVSCSAGNSGPYNASLSNEAPWILTVGASTVDRAIRATVLLGNYMQLDGQSMYQPKDFPSDLLPLVYAGANGNIYSKQCNPGSLRNVDVKGKIVLCERGYSIFSQGQEVKNNGGVAMIVMNDQFNGYITVAANNVLPASHVSYVAGLAIIDYINSTSSPMATILFKGTVYGLPEAPQIAYFSSRGPSRSSPGILKPDVIGPGYNILAAWPYNVDNNTTPSNATFNVISGTSMSCPHLSGVAALLKSSHPDWSPAAIKSAILTTTNLNNLGGNPISDQQFVPATVFDMGAGHVNASRANDPGLVYDLLPDDYIPYLCGLNYTDKEVSLVVQHNVTCSNYSVIPEAQLNYPTFSIRLGSTPLTYTRTVTNVGSPNSAYVAVVVPPPGVDINVRPENFVFNGVNQKVSYSVTFSRNGSANGTFSQGYLFWVDLSMQQYVVKSAIAVIFT